MNTSTLLLSDFGNFCGKRHERIVVRISDNSEEEIPLFRLQEIIIAKQGVSISSDVIDEAVKVLGGHQFERVRRAKRAYAQEGKT